ncbi:SH3 domain-containing protein [Aminobacter niigataensis]|uniref:SH3 domain-containing protein n=1 Tax=Aminobacter niigataensis TaxID=83265 RepID=UPI0024CA32B9|nr:SH3 domain-containing protein [Aminobacter niigataensis]CAI2932616.1 conserved protein of unknown function [Aminobacter niigataensis]
MNTLAFRRAGIPSRLAEQLRQSGASLSRPNLSRPGIALVVGAAAVAVALAGFLIIGTSEPDPTQTAAVPPRMTQPQPVSPVPVAQDEKPVATVQPSQPASSKLAAAPLISGETPKAQFSPSPPIASNVPDSATGPDERSSGTVALADTSVPATAEAPDTSDTASIVPDGLRGTLDVQVAETEAEIAMLEASTGMIDATAAIERPLPDMSPAKAAKYANLRDGPADEAKVIVVVPANAAIEAETGCNWCTVVYNGQRGYMFKSLIRRSVKEEAAAGQGLF